MAGGTHRKARRWSVRTQRGRRPVIIVEGKDVYTDLQELVAPAYTALILIDMQRDFVEPDGAFGRMGDRREHVHPKPAQAEGAAGGGPT